jgi:type I restriction enzyme S subunit
MTATEEKTHRLRPYPSYKDSGVEWIGEIPEGWEVSNGRKLFKNSNTRAPNNSEQLAATQKYGVVPQSKFMEDEGVKVVLALGGTDNFKLVEPDDFVISLRSFQGGIEKSHFKGCITPAYTVLKPIVRICSQYMAFVLKNDGFISDLQSSTTGIREGRSIRYRDFAPLKLPIPSLEEQQAIATFLDRETARIDELMREQEALLDDLSHKRQATINAAVTGQEISGPRQEVDSIGSLPAHWEIVKLKKLAEVRSGVTKGRDLHGRQLVDVHYLRVANVQDGYLNLDDVATIPMPVEELERYSLKPGDVLMNEGGDNDKLGRGAVWRGEVTPCVHQNHVFSVRPHEVESDWLALINTSSYAKFFFFINSKQSTNLASISSSTIKELPVVLPPATERRQLLDHVAQQLAQIDELREEVRANIEDMRIHRSALITAAVTGKIDVRPEAE